MVLVEKTQCSTKDSGFHSSMACTSVERKYQPLEEESVKRREELAMQKR
jgi:hypothetical protein